MSTSTPPRRSTRSAKREPSSAAVDDEQVQPEETSSKYFLSIREDKVEPISPPSPPPPLPLEGVASSELKVTMITPDDLKPDLVDGQSGRKRSRPSSTQVGGRATKRTRRPSSSSSRRTRTTVKLEQDHSGSPPSSPLTDLEDLPQHLQLPLPRTTPIDLKPEPKDEGDEDEDKDEDEKKPKIKKSTPKKPTIKLKLDKPHPEPRNWERQYGLIEVMRGKIVAPVDTLGCDTPNGERTSDPKTVRFHILISLMLSSQTKDPVTSQAVTNLHTNLPSGLTASSLASADPEVISECINKVGFWRRKTEYIQAAARAILEGGLDEGEAVPDGWEESGWGEVEGEKGDVPRTLGGLCRLKGVGPKMAFLVLQCAWNINAGVGVDVHVHRITNRLGWHKPKTTDPEQTRLNLQSWLPNRLFKPINHVLVGFGQVVCLPVGPRCDVCLLAKEKICPARTIGGNYKGRKEVGVSFEDVGVVFKHEEEGGGKGNAVVVEKDAAAGEAKVEIKIEQEGVVE